LGKIADQRLAEGKRFQDAETLHREFDVLESNA